jgi:hypothetical protein
LQICREQRSFAIWAPRVNHTTGCLSVISFGNHLSHVFPSALPEENMGR